MELYVIIRRHINLVWVLYSVNMKCLRLNLCYISQHLLGSLDSSVELDRSTFLIHSSALHALFLPITGSLHINLCLSNRKRCTTVWYVLLRTKIPTRKKKKVATGFSWVSGCNTTQKVRDHRRVATIEVGRGRHVSLNFLLSCWCHTKNSYGICAFSLYSPTSLPSFLNIVAHVGQNAEEEVQKSGFSS